MDNKSYWSYVDENRDNLIKNGFIKFPSLSSLDLDKFASKIYLEMNGKTFCELGKSHNDFLEFIGIREYLAPKLLSISREFGYKGNLSNQYHIARMVEKGNTTEMYRAHFDSHLFTMVIPLKIPDSFEPNGSVGDLVYFPNSRIAPKNEIMNFISKAYHKRYASKEGLDKFSEKKKRYEDNFHDYKPLLFIGNRTLHTNKPVTSDCSTFRLTLLAHFFDPSPRYGIGAFLRLLRNR